MAFDFTTLPAEVLLTLTAYGEAASEGAEGMMAVLNVVNNRAKALSTYGDSAILARTGSPYHAVILKKLQFSAFNEGDPVRPKLEAIANNFSSNLLTNSALNKAYTLAKDLLQGTLPDNTNGSTHYHRYDITPYWSASIEKIGQIGNHIFYSALPIWQRVTQIAAKPMTITIVISLLFGLLIMQYYKSRP